MPSLLPVVQAADNFPAYPGLTPTHSAGQPFTPLHLTRADASAVPPLRPIGLLRPEVLDALLKRESEWDVVRDDGGKITAVAFVAESEAERSALLAETAVRWKAEGLFADALDGWRNEKYAIYGDTGSTGTGEDLLGFTLERAACAIFGVATRGVHLTAYEGSGADMLIWVPRRAANKPTWPGYLDNTVAGGIIAGMTPQETIVKECGEEASLPPQFVTPRLRNVGAATYTYITPTGWIQPEIEYLYDLHLPPRDSAEYITPRPHDDEVESFEVMTIPQVLEALHAGQFKPNCGLTLVDFLIRHGLVTPENEPNYLQIQWHIRRPVGRPSWQVDSAGAESRAGEGTSRTAPYTRPQSQSTTSTRSKPRRAPQYSSDSPPTPTPQPKHGAVPRPHPSRTASDADAPSPAPLHLSPALDDLERQGVRRIVYAADFPVYDYHHSPIRDDEDEDYEDDNDAIMADDMVTRELTPRFSAMPGLGPGTTPNDEELMTPNTLNTSNALGLNFATNSGGGDDVGTSTAAKGGSRTSEATRRRGEDPAGAQTAPRSERRPELGTDEVTRMFCILAAVGMAMQQQQAQAQATTQAHTTAQAQEGASGTGAPRDARDDPTPDGAQDRSADQSSGEQSHLSESHSHNMRPAPARASRENFTMPSAPSSTTAQEPTTPTPDRKGKRRADDPAPDWPRTPVSAPRTGQAGSSKKARRETSPPTQPPDTTHPARQPESPASSSRTKPRERSHSMMSVMLTPPPRARTGPEVIIIDSSSDEDITFVGASVPAHSDNERGLRDGAPGDGPGMRAAAYLGRQVCDYLINTRLGSPVFRLLRGRHYARSGGGIQRVNDYLELCDLLEVRQCEASVQAIKDFDNWVRGMLRAGVGSVEIGRMLP